MLIKTSIMTTHHPEKELNDSDGGVLKAGALMIEFHEERNGCVSSQAKRLYNYMQLLITTKK